MIRRTSPLEPVNDGHLLGEDRDIHIRGERQKISRGSQSQPGRRIYSHQNRNRTLASDIFDHPAVPHQRPDGHASRLIRRQPGVEAVMVARNSQHGGIDCGGYGSPGSPLVLVLPTAAVVILRIDEVARNENSVAGDRVEDVRDERGQVGTDRPEWKQPLMRGEVNVSDVDEDTGPCSERSWWSSPQRPENEDNVQGYRHREQMGNQRRGMTYRV